MLLVCSSLKIIDFLVWQDSKPQELPFWSLILDHALVLRPDALQHKPGHRRPTGRSLGRRVMDSLWPLSRAFFQMCACEALNAILMQHDKGLVIFGASCHCLIRCLATSNWDFQTYMSGTVRDHCIKLGGMKHIKL
eukprot:1134535-Pelagomonas_calceolata.AAC.3